MSEDSIYKARIPARGNTHRVRDVDYYINEWGDPNDPLVVFLHGWGDSGATFQFVVDALASRWHVIAPDWRGFGRTYHRARGYWFPDYLADLDDLLSKYSPAAPVRLVGHSMGGNVGGLYAGVMPERVRAFVNVEGFGLLDTRPIEAPARYREWLQQSREVPAFRHFDSLEAMARHVAKRSPRMSAAQARFVAAAWAAEGPDGLTLRADPAHKLPNPVLYRRAEAEACWRNVTAPVLLVAGADSAVLDAVGTRPSDGALPLPFPDSHTRIIEACGHMVHFEAPDILAAAIEDFLLPTR
ncbi:MAG TPA: alpha/beta hydrolase [Woeseiaceae bacterium]|nr:alpha/beta hydrolase [Woeseiaceae bacterium]